MTRITVLAMFYGLGVIGAGGFDLEPVRPPLTSAADRSDTRAQNDVPQLPLDHWGSGSPEAVEMIGVSLTPSDLWQLCAIPELRSLSLQSCPLCRDKCAIVAGSHQLVELQLIDARLTDSQLSSLGSLAGLQHLDLRGNPLSDAGLAALAGLEQLEWLDLRGTQVTADGVRALQRQRPALRIACDVFVNEPARQVQIGEVCE